MAPGTCVLIYAILISAEAALRDTHDDLEAKALFLGSFRTGCILPDTGMRPQKKRSNMTDCTVGSGNLPI
jgi:hypothetical protein